MTPKKILIFSTYPIKNPQHGGQKRLTAVIKELRSAGMQVKHVAIFHPDHYQFCDKDDIPVRGKLIKKINQSPFTGDVECGEAIISDSYVRNRVAKLINYFKPDIIDIEQAFPYLGLKPLLQEMNLNPIIAFGSHNIEYVMKEEMLNSLNYAPGVVKKIVSKIKSVETELVKDAKLISVVSEADAKELHDIGANKCIVAPNGIYETHAEQADIYYWRRLFDDMGVSKIALFVGSAHPPNWIGFQEMVGRSLGFLAKDTRIVLAGSIADYIEHELEKLPLDIGAVTFDKRAYFAGRLSEAHLLGLIAYAHTIILPITEGGGSNLKTAEAIISGKRVVATTYAFRGFETLKKLPGIALADQPEDFRKSILKSIDMSAPKRSEAETELQKSVDWGNCLKELVEGFKVL